MEHANLADDLVADPGPLDFDQPVERLMEGRKLRGWMHFLLEEDEAGEPMPIELSLRALCERIDLGDLVHVRGGRQDLEDGPPRPAVREAHDRPAEGHPEVREVNRGTQDESALLHIMDRLFAPRVPVDDPEAVLLRHRFQIDPEVPEFFKDGVGRVGRNDNEAARARLEAFRKESQRKSELFLAGWPLEEDARALGQASLDHLVEAFDSRSLPRHLQTPPSMASVRTPALSSSHRRFGCS